MSKQAFYTSQFDCSMFRELKFSIQFCSLFFLAFCSKAPTWLTKFAPEDALVMQEEAWNAYPMCKSGVYSYLAMHTGGMFIFS